VVTVPGGSPVLLHSLPAFFDPPPPPPQKPPHLKTLLGHFSPPWPSPPWPLSSGLEIPPLPTLLHSSKAIRWCQLRVFPDSKACPSIAFFCGNATAFLSPLFPLGTEIGPHQSVFFCSLIISFFEFLLLTLQASREEFTFSSCSSGYM